MLAISWNKQRDSEHTKHKKTLKIGVIILLLFFTLV